MATVVDNIMEKLKESEEGEVFRGDHNATKWTNVVYDINGDLVSRDQFKTLKNGKLVKTGDYETYQNGTLIKSGSLKRGKTVGDEVLYYQDGSPKVINPFNDKSELHGLQKIYNTDGTLKSTIEYSKGKDVYNEWLKKHKVTNSENPLHFYDYRGAYEAGDLPDSIGKWPSKHKHDLHPDRFLREDGGWYDSKYNRGATEEDVIIQNLQRSDYLQEWENISDWYDKSKI